MSDIETADGAPKPEVLSGPEKGEKAFGFIQDIANKLAQTPEFSQALVREFFDRNAQLNPRHYGVNVTKGDYLYHISSFGGYYRVEAPKGNTGLRISKFDVRLLGVDQDKAFLGAVDAGANWVVENREKKFTSGYVSYRDQETGFQGIKGDTALSLSKGQMLVADLVNPVSF